MKRSQLFVGLWCAIAVGTCLYSPNSSAIKLKGCVGVKFVPIIGFEHYRCYGTDGLRYVVNGTRFGLEASASVRASFHLGGRSVVGRHCGLSVSGGLGVTKEVQVHTKVRQQSGKRVRPFSDSTSIGGGVGLGAGASVGFCVNVSKADQNWNPIDESSSARQRNAKGHRYEEDKSWSERVFSAQ